MCVHRTNRCESTHFALVSIQFSMLLLLFTALPVVVVAHAHVLHIIGIFIKLFAICCCHAD